MSENISAILITYNEESCLERALKSLDFVQEIILLDSYSTDRTVEIARKYGAKIFQESFLAFGDQKNKAILKAQGPWIFWLDADEWVDEQLKKEVLLAVQKKEQDLFLCSRLTYMQERPMKYGGWFPDYVPRLFKKEAYEFNFGEIHEYLQERKTQKKIKLKKFSVLSGLIHHHSFPTWRHQVLTNLKYAQIQSRRYKSWPKYKLICWSLVTPWRKFFEVYFLRLGFLDGIAGLGVAINAAYSHFLRYWLALEK